MERSLTLDNVISGGIISDPVNTKRFETDFFGNHVADPESDELVVLDKDWLSGRFMTPFKDMPSKYKYHLIKSPAHFMFQDTSIGGNMAVNSKPQFTRHADIRADDFFYPYVYSAAKDKVAPITYAAQGTTAETGPQLSLLSVTPFNGLGRHYGESINTGRQFVYLQFGVARFNGILDYLLNSVTYTEAVIANEGRLPSAYTAVDNFIGALTMIAMPTLTFLSWAVKGAIETLVGNKPFNYYYMEPAMHIYWGTVNTIANQIALAMGIMAPIAQDSENDPTAEARKENVTGQAYRFSQEMIDGINEMFAPDSQIFSKQSNYIDVAALMLRYQNFTNEILKTKVNTETLATDPTVEDVQKYIYNLLGTRKETLANRLNQKLYLYDQMVADTIKPDKVDGDQNPYSLTVKSLQQRNEEEKASEEEKKKQQEEAKKSLDQQMKEKEEGSVWDSLGAFFTNLAGQGKQNLRSWAKTFDSSARGASNQVVLAVDYTGSTSESFSNSVGEIDTGSKIKSLSKGARNAKFNFSGGQTGLGVLDTVIKGAIDITNNVLDHATFGLSNIVRGLVTGGYTDIPKVWEDSEASLPTITYSMELVAPYGNAWSRFQNIMVPLSVILAGSLPLRVGKSGYTSPFLCSCFSKSVHHVQLGMITDISLTRGTSNLGHTIDKKVNAVTVSFTVTDFGHKVCGPINPSLFGGLKIFHEEATPTADFITALAGRDYHEFQWLWAKMKYRWSAIAKGYAGLMAPSNTAIRVGELVYNSFLSAPLTNFSPPYM